jgi:signal transduction histidine kinase
LDIRYTALDLRAPEKCRFKYRLDGVDSDWVDANTHRTAHYNNVAPGAYHFHVLACNKDGVWNDTGASLDLELRPHLWQTWWFQSLAVAALVGTVVGIVRFILGQKMRQKLALLEMRHSLERERVRIARDLHDDLGSGLTHIVFQSEILASRNMAPGETQRRSRTIAEAAAETVKSLDEIVWAVSSRHDTLDSLLQYLSQFAAELFNETGISLTLDLPAEPPPIPLNAETRHNIFLAVKEALNNSLKHSHARRVELSVTVRGVELRIAVSDDGVGGVDANRLADHQRDGLANMRQRVRELSGTLSIESPPNQGTCIAMILPLQNPVANP